MSATPQTGTDAVEAGRRLGHDLFRYGRPCGVARLPGSVREGVEQAAARGIRTESSDRFVRKWLQLRLGAYQRGRAFDERVTPALIRSIDAAACPVLRVALTHGERKETDWSVDRLNNDGAYALNNLAVMSTRANRAKGSRSFEQAFALSTFSAPTDGLQPVEWLRLASLMLGPCFADRPQDAPCIPLAAPLAPRSVCLAMQQVRHVFTLQCGTQAGKNALIKQFGRASPSERSAMRLDLLAEAVHAGLKGIEHPHDVWLGEAVMGALRRWRDSLSTDAWALAGAVSSRLAGSRQVPPSRLASWRLESRGYLTTTC